MRLRTFGQLIVMAGLFLQTAEQARPQAMSSSKWSVTIVLPPRVVAGRPATLAVLGVDGRLASDVIVDVGGDQHVTTDGSGRAGFTVPLSGDVLIVRASGSSAATLVDSTRGENAKDEIWAPPVVALREPFFICGSRFRSEADTNHVRLDGEPALVMAASPECLAVMPSSKAAPGAAAISVQTPSGQWTAHSTLVALEPELPQPALLPGQQGRLIVGVRGSELPLRVAVENRTPGVLRFLKGDIQELSTSGGSRNCAALDVAAIRSGDFSVDARLVSAADESAARRYLHAAASLAAKKEQREIDRLATQLEGNHPHVDSLRRELDRMLADTIEGDLRTLLTAARGAL